MTKTKKIEVGKIYDCNPLLPLKGIVRGKCIRVYGKTAAVEILKCEDYDRKELARLNGRIIVPFKRMQKV